MVRDVRPGVSRMRGTFVPPQISEGYWSLMSCMFVVG
jgi:hypothetical protein